MLRENRQLAHDPVHRPAQRRSMIPTLKSPRPPVAEKQARHPVAHLPLRHRAADRHNFTGPIRRGHTPSHMPLGKRSHQQITIIQTGRPQANHYFMRPGLRPDFRPVCSFKVFPARLRSELPLFHKSFLHPTGCPISIHWLSVAHTPSRSVVTSSRCARCFTFKTGHSAPTTTAVRAPAASAA